MVSKPLKASGVKKPTVATAKKKQRTGKPCPDYVGQVLAFFDEYYPEAGCSLKFDNPFQLLVATILSAQCTDERVNKTTPALFEHYPTPVAMAGANPEALEGLIKSCGFYHNKAKNILAASNQIAHHHQGLVPHTLDELVALPGVGRKTANVVLGNAFGVPGLTVDTHLGRLSRRLGLSSHENPEKVEADLALTIPQPRWTLFSHQAIAHGRALCQSRKPRCEECPLGSICPKTGVV